MNDNTVPAVVLAAGEGRRLDPLTNRRPKPMVPIANRPILEYVIEAIADANIDKIVLVVGYRQERIRNYFGDGNDWGVDIEYVVQEKQLGTAHAVLQVESTIEKPFLLLNGDCIVETALVERVRDKIANYNSPVMSVTRSSYPSDYGVVALDGDRVCGITEKPEQPTTSEIINAGVYGFNTSIFDEIRETPTEHGERAITTTLERIAEDNPIRPIRYRDAWLDVSYLWDLLDVNAIMTDKHDVSENSRVDKTIAPDTVIGADITLGSNVTIGGSTAIGDNVTIEPNAVVSNSVILSDVVIEAGAVVRDAVIAENARIGANTTIAGGESTITVEGEVYEDVDLGGIIGDSVTVGSSVTVEPGTIIGDGATIDHGVHTDGRIESDAIVTRG